MALRVTFIERRDADTASIERVFRQVRKSLDRLKVETLSSKLPFGNSFANLIGNLIKFRAGDCDVHHITGHVHYMALRRDLKPVVLTIHDLGILRQRRGLRRWLIKRLFFDLPVKRASAVTVISEATKRELIAETHIDPERVAVVYNPLKEEFESVASGEFRSEKPRLLQIGTAPHKNLDRVAQALQGYACELAVVGSLSQGQNEMLDESGIDYSHIEYLDDNGIIEQYRNSDILIFCSTFEGFGLPIIEAQAMRIPVVTSNIDPMREVAGDGALLVDPFDPTAIRDAIETIRSNESVRADLIAKGTRNIRRFTREKVAERYLEIYERVRVSHGSIK